MRRDDARYTRRIGAAIEGADTGACKRKKRCDEYEEQTSYETQRSFEQPSVLLAKSVLDTTNTASHVNILEQSTEDQRREETPEVVSSDERSNNDNEGLHYVFTKARNEFEKSFVDCLREVGLKRRIVHDVYELPDDGLGGRFRRTIIRESLGSDDNASSRNRSRRQPPMILFK